MASPGNQNQPAPPFDVAKIFSPNPQNPPPNIASSPYPAVPFSYPPPPSASYPPPAGGVAFSYPAQTAPFQYHHHMPYAPDQHPNLHPQRSPSYPTPSLQPPSPRNITSAGGSPNPGNPNAGARLMALLSAPPSSNLDSPPVPSQPSIPLHPPLSELPVPTSVPGFPAGPILHPAMVPSGPRRMASNNLPRGRHLVGDNAVYDVDVRFHGEVQPQLEVTPITKYGSDPQLVLGRQIAVNKAYICYGLKQGNIRVLNINTALRSLLRGHTQRVTDMAFFADDVNLLASVSIDGRVFVWKISEGPEEEDKPQITGSVVIAIQIVGEVESVHPRVCWHCHKQEVLVVGIGKCVLRIDTTKVGKGKVFSAEVPIKCPVEKLIDGIQFVGKHDGEVTDLSMCQWMTTRLVSGSMDGTIKIWEDRKSQPLVVLRPHDGQPVNAALFLTSPHRPDHIILITAGPLNREVKIWASASEEGWLLPSDDDFWKCTQTLELKSSSQPHVEEAFFNQVVALSQSGVVLLANAKKNAIYVVHLDYGSYPAETCMDYMAEFTVTMPILSFTGTSDILPQGEHVIQVYCVQTQAIQQYALDLSLCLPPPLDNVGVEKLDFEAATSLEITSSNMECKPATLTTTSCAAEMVSAATPLPSSPRVARKASSLRSPADSSGPALLFCNHGGDQQPVPDYSVDGHLSDLPSVDDGFRIDGMKIGRDDVPSAMNPSIMFKRPTHLITPSEILMAASSSEITNAIESNSDGEANIQDVVVNNDLGNALVEVRMVSEQSNQNGEVSLEAEPQKLFPENKEKFLCSHASDLGIEMAKECCAIPPATYNTEETQQVDGAGITEPLSRPHAGEEVHATVKDTSGKVSESAMCATALQSPAPSVKGKKQKGKSSQVSGPSSPSLNVFNSMDSSNERGGISTLPSAEAAFAQVGAMQEMLNQLITMQREQQKQMTMLVAVPVTKEGKRLEAAIGRSVEKAVKANNDALWARFQEENSKTEKLSQDRAHQIASLITNFTNKDLQTVLEKTVKKELAAVGQAVVRASTPVIEKTIASAVTDAFQRGVGDKTVNQLEKSVNSKLETTVARQIQAQFQTSGKQALQESLKSSFKASVIPAFEMSCKAMFDQVDATFQKGIAEHTSAAQQHFESAHSPLALTLRDAVNSVSSLTHTLSGEFADGQRKLLALVAGGANTSALNPLVTQLSNGSLSSLHDKMEAPLDPTKELSRLISERKYVEAFTGALQRSDVSIVSWLCAQVDLHGLLSMVPMPLSQGVLLSLVQQLACDINSDMPRKLGWMTDVAAAINPTDPMIAIHVRPIFEQVYQILNQHRSLPTTTGAQLSNIRLLMHVINSMIMTCK